MAQGEPPGGGPRGQASLPATVHRRVFRTFWKLRDSMVCLSPPAGRRSLEQAFRSRQLPRGLLGAGWSARRGEGARARPRRWALEKPGPPEPRRRLRLAGRALPSCADTRGFDFTETPRCCQACGTRAHGSAALSAQKGGKETQNCTALSAKGQEHPREIMPGFWKRLGSSHSPPPSPAWRLEGLEGAGTRSGRLLPSHQPRGQCDRCCPRCGPEKGHAQRWLCGFRAPPAPEPVPPGQRRPPSPASLRCPPHASV